MKNILDTLKILAITTYAVTLTVVLFIGGMSLLKRHSEPIKVHTQADPLMLQDACITGYVGKLKPIGIDLVVDAHIYCSEKYPK